jgi:hypothetical protein
LGEDALDRHGRCANAKRTRASTSKGTRSVEPAVDPRQEIPAPAQKVVTVPSQPDVSADSLKQPQSEFRFKISDLTPQRRLSNVKPRRALRESSRIGYRDEIAEMPELHKRSMPDRH